MLVATTRASRKRVHGAAPAVINARNASSTSSSQRESLKPALVTGWDARWGSIERNLLRLPRLTMYLRNDFFAPSLSCIHHAFLYSALNAPQQLDLDLGDFLVGAETATKRVIEDVFSLDFAKYLTDGESSSRVERMQTYCLPSCFQRLQSCSMQALAKGMREAIHVDVDSVHLTRVMYERLCGTESPSEEDGELIPSQEHLQLQVEVRTSERVRQVDPVRGLTSELFQRNVYVVRLASNVTSPKDVDWRLAMIAFRTKGKPNICSLH